MSDSPSDSNAARGSGWKGGSGGTCGVRVNSEFMHRFVKPDQEIVLRLDGWPEPVRLPYSPSIHRTCPEFRGAGLTAWFRERGLLHWDKGEPPEFVVEAMKEENHFFIRLLR